MGAWQQGRDGLRLDDSTTAIVKSAGEQLQRLGLKVRFAPVRCSFMVGMAPALCGLCVLFAGVGGSAQRLEGAAVCGRLWTFAFSGTWGHRGWT